MNEGANNPDMDQKCPQCGAPLPVGVLAGLCPACLFKQGAAADTAVPPETPPFQPPGVTELAGLFPQLEIIALIGKGGMGAVYQARQRGLDRIVALKILPTQTASGPGFIERFNREARALARLNHPNIVAVYEFGQVNGLPFFVMEFVDGLNLRQLERAGKLTAREALQIVPQICEALQFAHDEGIVHRDIKPENILLDKKGRVKIADFGIAKILSNEPDVSITQTGGAIGTPHYMAPEQMEKPTTVDHRADIFSLGVVFYEMLTGELPLGKFAPPSSRKIEVDVRLDDVVLRALEKDPELRYQHASQVKTAVDTIAGSAAPPPGGHAAPPGSFAQDYQAARDWLGRPARTAAAMPDYTLDIGSCVRRAWALLKGEFWPMVGITTLIIGLLAFLNTVGGPGILYGIFGRRGAELGFALTMLLWGPLLGGLQFYFLKKVRRQPATVETAFKGFSQGFIQLFLAGMITKLFIWLGFIFLILPGIYLLVAWVFPLLLVLDKGMDFWSAMELSRRVVTKHWFKVFGLIIVLALLGAAGLLLLGLGVLMTVPLALIALVYAYEDILGGIAPASPGAASTGPSGTVVMPPATPPAGRKPRKWLLIGVVILVSLLFMAAACVAAVMFYRSWIRPPQQPPQVRWHWQTTSAKISAFKPAKPVAPGKPTARGESSAFGPVIERDLQARITGTNQFLDLDSQQVLTPAPEIMDAMQPRLDEDSSRAWSALDISPNSRRFQYLTWLKENGVDLMFAGDGKLIGFDGLFPIAHGNTSTNWDDWDSLTPDQARAAVAVVDWGRRAADARLHNKPIPPAPKSGGIYNSAAQLDSREAGGPVVNLLTRDQSVNWFFKTREGRLGILQLVSLTNDPSAVRIRYKLVQPGTNQNLTVDERPAPDTAENLLVRLDAASNISDMTEKCRALAVVALAAARAHEVPILKQALEQMDDYSRRNQTAHDVAVLLSKDGLKKPAIEIAKDISDYSVRNRTLSELAE